MSAKMLNVRGKIYCGSAALIIWTLNEGEYAMTDRDKKLIRNSTAEFLIFTGQAGEQSIEARYEDETIWLTQQIDGRAFSILKAKYQPSYPKHFR